MRKDIITKRVIQAIAVCFGLLGLSGIYLCVHCAVTFVWDREMFEMLHIIAMMLLIEVVTVAIAYQNLRHFGPNSIRSMTGLVTFYLYSILIAHVGPYLQLTREPMMGLLYVAGFLILILPAYIFYSVVSRKLIRMTKTKNIQQNGEADAENGAG